MKLSIIIPFRNREEHLVLFLENIINKTNQEFDVLVVEQFNDKQFNRGKLLNIGFDYKKNTSDYFCFHDVDMIPKEVDYSYPQDGTVHLATKVSQFNYKMPSSSYFGGVNLFTKDDFIKINGFSNDYWGWGAEDDDLRLRVVKNKIKITRRDCVFESLQHNRKIDQECYKKNSEKMRSKYDYQLDGLSNLSYNLLKSETLNEFAEKIKVDL